MCLQLSLRNADKAKMLGRSAAYLVFAWTLGACASLAPVAARKPSSAEALPVVQRPAACGELLAQVGTPERALQLAWDPAHQRITSNSAREAKIGLYLEQQGLLPGPITREASGASEFIDATGQSWDVKAFRSHDPNGERIPLAHMISKIDEEIASGENLILDISLLDEADRVSIVSHLKQIHAKDRALWYDDAAIAIEN